MSPLNKKKTRRKSLSHPGPAAPQAVVQSSVSNMLTIKLAAGVFEYDPTKPLGKRGGFGQVFAGKTVSGEDVAIKELHVSAADAAHRELRIVEELKGDLYKHVISFIDAGEDADTGNYFVVMSKADSSLQGFLEKNGPLVAAECSSILLQIVTGLLEVGDLVHRDLKPDKKLPSIVNIVGRKYHFGIGMETPISHMPFLM